MNKEIKQLQAQANKSYLQHKADQQSIKEAEDKYWAEATKKFIGKYVRLKKGRGSYPLYDPMNYQYIFIRKVSSKGIYTDTFFQEAPGRFCFRQDVWIEFSALLRMLKKTDEVTKEEYEKELKRYLAAAAQGCTTKTKKKINYRYGTLQKPEIK